MGERRSKPRPPAPPVKERDQLDVLIGDIDKIAGKNHSQNSDELLEYENLDGRYDLGGPILRRRMDDATGYNLNEIFNNLSKSAQDAIIQIVDADQAGVFRGFQLTGLESESTSPDTGTPHDNTFLTAVFDGAKTKTELPDAPPELYAQRANRKEKPPEFIKRVYGDWLGRGLTQADIGRLDKQLYAALQNWLRHSSLPADVDLPSKKEMNSRQLEALGVTGTQPHVRAEHVGDLRERMRLERAASRRISKIVQHDF